MSVPKRSDIAVGDKVGVETKADQGTGRLTEGVVEAVLTSSEDHPHGIKVRLQDGNIGRVKSLAGPPAPAGRQFADLASGQMPAIEDSGNGFKEFYRYDREIEKQGGLAGNERHAAAEAKKTASLEPVAAAICAVGNKDGGSLYVGVRDDGRSAGFQKDLHLRGSADYKDAMASHMADLLKTLIRDDAFVMSKLRIEFRYVEGAPVWTIQVLPSDRPLFLHGSRGKEFYVRGVAPRSERLDGQEMARYIYERFQRRV